MLLEQTQTLFFNFDGSMPHLPPTPTDDAIRTMLAHNNQSCPLNEIIVSEANSGNLRNLRRFAFSAYRRANRSCRGCNFGIYSPPGQGKTFVVKKFAETIGIPFVFIQSPALENSHMLFQHISEALENFGTPLINLREGNEEKDGKESDFYLPPCIIFFDEANELKKNLMKGSLLNAMEPDDAILTVKQPGMNGKVIRVDCWEVCWIAATTERGDLFDAFDSRLSTSIEWHSANINELTMIVKAGLQKKVDSNELPFTPPDFICELISKYQKVPRLAIHGFGTKVVHQKLFTPNYCWKDCFEIVASDIGMNDFGFTEKQTVILSALGQRPIAEPRLADIARCRIAQIKKHELPGMMQYTDDGPYIISVSGKGMCITKSGLRKLDEMGIKHNGTNITAEHFESKRSY